MTKHRKAINKVIVPIIINAIRQDISDSMITKGDWVRIPPMFPIKDVNPVIVPNFFSSYHFDNIFKIDMNTTETPIPTRNLPAKI